MVSSSPAIGIVTGTFAASRRGSRSRPAYTQKEGRGEMFNRRGNRHDPASWCSCDIPKSL